MDLPNDFVNGAVQAALSIDTTNAGSNATDEICQQLSSMGLDHQGEAKLADGTSAGAVYAALPYLMVSMSPERGDKIVIQLFYHRRDPSSLEQWINEFCTRIETETKMKCNVFEPASTGPF